VDHAASDVDGYDPRFHQPKIVVEARDDGLRDGAGGRVRKIRCSRKLPANMATREAIAGIPSAADVSVEVSAGAMQVELALDRGALAR
jgi:hypothetical protein